MKEKRQGKVQEKGKKRRGKRGEKERKERKKNCQVEPVQVFAFFVLVISQLVD